MNLAEILSDNTPPGRARAELDLPSKSYVVYDKDNNEIARHKFKEIWDSSPAKRAAEAQANELIVKDMKAEKDAHEARPYTDFEKEYIAKLEKWHELFPRLKSPDPEVKTATEIEMNALMDRMNRLNTSGLIRRSAILHMDNKRKQERVNKNNDK